MMTIVFGLFLLTLLVIVALAIVKTKNLFVAAMLLSIFSLLTASNFFVLDAADVALTEAAVGAGVTTVIFLSALRLTSQYERGTLASTRWIAILVVVVTTILLIFGTFDSQRLGDPNAPVQTHVAPYYIENTDELMGFPNIVTAVLSSFRGYDTLGEVFVVFVAAIGVMFILDARNATGPEYELPEEKGLKHHLIPRAVGGLLVPFIILFGFYVQFHGEYGPGGGFQAGAIVATAFILYAILEGERTALRVFPRKLQTGLVVGGATLYGAVGVTCMVKGGTFLDYSALLDDPVFSRQIGIIAIELGVGMAVCGALLSIFHSFAARQPTGNIE
jgi:multicomponent Na+:H+ antiporter subunit B